MDHRIDTRDREFMARVEACTFPVDAFDHAAHVRLAYVYLVEAGSTDAATDRMRATLLGLLRHAGIDPATKYHETMTTAWILAVHHFMAGTGASESSADFIARNPRLLDSRIMQTHYSTELLFSAAARAAFVEPDRAAIPRHGG